MGEGLCGQPRDKWGPLVLGDSGSSARAPLREEGKLRPGGCDSGQDVSGLAPQLRGAASVQGGVWPGLDGDETGSAKVKGELRRGGRLNSTGRPSGPAHSARPDITSSPRTAIGCLPRSPRRPLAASCGGRPNAAGTLTHSTPLEFCSLCCLHVAAGTRGPSGLDEVLGVATWRSEHPPVSAQVSSTRRGPPCFS